MSWSVVAEMSSWLSSEFTAVTIYFTLGLPKVHNISDDCCDDTRIINERLSEISESVKDVSVQLIHHLLSALVNWNK